MKKFIILTLALCLVGIACDDAPSTPTGDQIQQKQEARLTMEASAETGMPNIKNFRERKLLKDIFEMRDQNITTYTYVYNDMRGCMAFLGNSIGFGIPYATQYTNPNYIAKENDYQSGSYAILPQSDPNGLFDPVSAEGTWVMLVDPANAKNVKPVYVEPRITVSPFELAGAVICKP